MFIPRNRRAKKLTMIEHDRARAIRRVVAWWVSIIKVNWECNRFSLSGRNSTFFFFSLKLTYLGIMLFSLLFARFSDRLEALSFRASPNRHERRKAKQSIA